MFKQPVALFGIVGSSSSVNVCTRWDAKDSTSNYPLKGLVGKNEFGMESGFCPEDQFDDQEVHGTDGVSFVAIHKRLYHLFRNLPITPPLAVGVRGSACVLRPLRTDECTWSGEGCFG